MSYLKKGVRVVIKSFILAMLPFLLGQIGAILTVAGLGFLGIRFLYRFYPRRDHIFRDELISLLLTCILVGLFILAFQKVL